MKKASYGAIIAPEEKDGDIQKITRHLLVKNQFSWCSLNLQGIAFSQAFGLTHYPSIHV
jgi:hypothetical protein